MGDLTAREAALFEAVWRNGMPSSERVVYDAVPMAQREQVLKRLEAVFRADQGGDLATAAELAGLKRAAFYNLRRAWRDDGLRGVVPRDTGGARPIRGAEGDPDEAMVRSAILGAPANARNLDIAKRLASMDPLAERDDAHERLTRVQRLQRSVQAARRILANDPAYLDVAYGRALLVDLTAVNMAYEAPSAELAVAALVVEAASGLVIGSEIGRLEEAPSLQRAAITAALEFLTEERADVRRAKDDRCDLTIVPIGDNAEAFAGGDLRLPSVDELTVLEDARYAFGAAVVQSKGPFIGRLRLVPRRTLKVDLAEYLGRRLVEVGSPARVRALWTREVMRQNEPVLEALRKTSVVGVTGAGGVMGATLLELANVLGVSSAASVPLAERGA